MAFSMFVVDPGGFRWVIDWFRSVEKVEVGKDCGGSCFRVDSGVNTVVSVSRRLFTGVEHRSGESGGAWATRGFSVAEVQTRSLPSVRFFLGLVFCGLGLCVGFLMFDCTFVWALPF
ncbi:unnamed protein product [Brassica rapa]|uniref:Transmembrane protein n=1 Tax=Brassica campestris TaxID=3711 RepID=A0A8D9CLX7_BRACM|nr:unnamed protein product [Brassica rapa]